MVATHDHSTATRAIGASQTNVLNWTTEIPTRRLTKLVFVFTSTGATALTMSTVSKIVVKANNLPIIDVTLDELRAYLYRFSKGGSVRPISAITTNPATATPLRRIAIPFTILDAATKDLQQTCQFPPDSSISVEITMVTGANQTGVAYLAYEQTDVEPLYYPKLIGYAANCPASQTNFRAVFNEPEGIVEGFIIPTIGLSRVRLVLDGVQVKHLLGQLTASAADYDANSDSMLMEMEQDDVDWSSLIAGTAGQDGQINSPFCFDVHAMRPAPQQNSFIELATNANWAGASNRIAIYAVVPLKRGG